MVFRRPVGQQVSSTCTVVCTRHHSMKLNGRTCDAALKKLFARVTMLKNKFARKKTTNEQWRRRMNRWHGSWVWMCAQRWKLAEQTAIPHCTRNKFILQCTKTKWGRMKRSGARRAGRHWHIKFGHALKFPHAIKRVYRTSWSWMEINCDSCGRMSCTTIRSHPTFRLRVESREKKK